MSKLKKTRIYITDKKGRYFRIASFSNPTDRLGERYIKLMFPDIKDVPLDAGTRSNDDIPEIKEHLDQGLQEFSYHYRSGVSHFKDGIGTIDAVKGLPNLKDNPALHLLRFAIFSLESFRPQELTEIDSNDFVLPMVFDGQSRALEFSVARVTGEWNVIVTKETPRFVGHYQFELDEPNVSLHMVDSTWMRPPFGGEGSRFELFRFDNPTAPFSPVLEP